LYRSKSWRTDNQAASAGDRQGLPVQIALLPGQMNDAPMAELLLNDLPAGADVIADKGYDADWIRELIEALLGIGRLSPGSDVKLEPIVRRLGLLDQNIGYTWYPFPTRAFWESWAFSRKWLH
jgi:hypothetical protein